MAYKNFLKFYSMALNLDIVSYYKNLFITSQEP